jgi:hypothetical protein
MAGVRTAYYLVQHLRSRQEVGDILRSYSTQVIEFRASIVIGSGSLSFEMIRALVERLPLMVCPRWVSTLAQPIAIEDLIAYLAAAKGLEVEESRIFEIGGPERVSYGDMMREYARQRRLRRLTISVPVLTPRLSSLWLGLVTPLYARVGRKLIDSIQNPTIVHDPSAGRFFSITPRTLREAVNRALKNEDREFAETRWSDAVSSAGSPAPWGGIRFGTRIVDSRVVSVPVPAETAFKPIRRIGGKTGWYYGNWWWRLRGFIDLLVGGVGLRRGGFLARGGRRRRPKTPPRGGDETARASLAGVRSRDQKRLCDHTPNGYLRSRRRIRTRVLVRTLPGPSSDVFRNAARYRGRVHKIETLLAWKR